MPVKDLLDFSTSLRTAGAQRRLFAVNLAYRDLRVTFTQMLCHGMGRVDRAVTAAGTAERHQERGESAPQIFVDRGVDQRLGRTEEGEYLAILFKKFGDLAIHAGEWFVTVITPGVMHRAAVEDKAAPVARRIFGVAFPV